MKWQNKSLSYWLRVLHRDLGYLMVGVCLIYAVSGILLNHMNGKDPAFRTTEAAVQLEKGMQAEELLAAWNRQEDLPPVKRVLSIDESHHRLMLEGGVGVYDAASGCVDYEVHEKRPVVYWFNRLHYNRIQGWNLMGDFFAVSLVFFAISGLFMVKGKNGLAGRGKWLLLAGILRFFMFQHRKPYVSVCRTLRFTQGKHTVLHRET